MTRAEEKAAAAANAAMAAASAAEEKTGHAMKTAGETLERDGAAYKRAYRGEQAKAEVKAEPAKKKPWECAIM